ncbi:MAG: hypothetical protein ACE5J2_04655 [Nitrososphaerales archaeon]
MQANSSYTIAFDIMNMGLFGKKFECETCGQKFKKVEEVVEHAKGAHKADIVDYNIEAGKGYSGAAKFRPVTVELQVSNVKVAETEYWINELTNQYADFVVENVKISPDKISFEIGSPSMSDLTAQDIKFRIDEYLTMNITPFQVKQVRVG